MLARRLWYKALCWQIACNHQRRGRFVSNAAGENRGSEGQHLKRSHRKDAASASAHRVFPQPVPRCCQTPPLRTGIVCKCILQGDLRIFLKNRCKLSLTSSLSSSHMEAGVKPTSRAQIRAKFNTHLDATCVLSSDIPPLHSPICSTESSCHASALPLLEMEIGSSYQVNL